MEILIGVCVAVLTVALVLVLTAAFRTLKQAGAAIEEARLTMNELREEVLQVSQDARAVVHNTNAVTLDAREKMKELDALFGSVREIGQAAYSLTSAVRETASGVVRKVKRSGAVAEKAVASVSGIAASGASASPAQTSSVEPRPQTRQAAGHAPARRDGGKEQATIAAIADGIASSIRIWNKLRQN